MHVFVFLLLLLLLLLLQSDFGRGACYKKRILNFSHFFYQSFKYEQVKSVTRDSLYQLQILAIFVSIFGNLLMFMVLEMTILFLILFVGNFLFEFQESPLLQITNGFVNADFSSVLWNKLKITHLIFQISRLQ